ncbi:TPA: hypothetical protein ACGO8I_001590 [Streptococcus suis]
MEIRLGETTNLVAKWTLRSLSNFKGSGSTRQGFVLQKATQLTAIPNRII